jgi:excisionase family DNA binding protein
MRVIEELTGYQTIRDVSLRFGVSTQYVHKLIKEGRLGYLQTPLGRLIPVEEVERLQKERETRDAA